MTLRERRRLYAITVAQVEDLAGRTLTPGELARVQDAIPHSSIPEALATILDGMGLCAAQDEDEDAEPAADTTPRAPAYVRHNKRDAAKLASSNRAGLHGPTATYRTNRATVAAQLRAARKAGWL